MTVGDRDHVSPFPGHSVRAPEEFASDHQTAADAGAKGEADHHRGAATCAIAVLGPRGGVCVVVNDERQLNATTEPCLKRFGPPGEVRGEAYNSLIVVYPPCCADAYRLDSVLLSKMLDSMHDRILDGLRAVRGSWFLPTIEDVARLVHYAGCHLGAADVDADTQQRHRRGPGHAAASRRSEGGQPSTLLLRLLSALSMIV